MPAYKNIYHSEIKDNRFHAVSVLKLVINLSLAQGLPGLPGTVGLDGQKVT